MEEEEEVGDVNNGVAWWCLTLSATRTEVIHEDEQDVGRPVLNDGTRCDNMKQRSELHFEVKMIQFKKNYRASPLLVQ